MNTIGTFCVKKIKERCELKLQMHFLYSALQSLKQNQNAWCLLETEEQEKIKKRNFFFNNKVKTGNHVMLIVEQVWSTDSTGRFYG